MLPLVLLGGALPLTFSYFFSQPFSPRLLGCGDHWTYFGPVHYFTDACLHRGELPLWNPLILCGNPFGANPQSLLFYPPNLIRSLLTIRPSPLATFIGMAVVVFLHVIVAGVLAFLLGRRLGLSRGASAVVMLGFILNLNFSGLVMVQWVLLATVSWLPGILLLVHRFSEVPGFRRGLPTAVAAGHLFGLSLLGGFPQLSIYMATLVAGYVALRRILILDGGARPPVSARARRLAVDGALLAVVAGVSVLAAAIMLVPALEFARYSGRGGASGLENTSLYDYFSYSLREVWEFLVVAGGAQDFRSLRGVGACILLLAAAGLTHPQRRSVAVWALLSLLFLDLTIGPPMPFARLLGAWAPFELGFAERAGVVLGLPLTVLAGYGVDAVAAAARTRRQGWIPAAGLAILAATVLVPLYVWTQPHRYLPVGGGVVAAPALLWLAMAAALRVRRPALWRVALPLLLFAELVMWNRVYIPEIQSRGGYRGSLLDMVGPRDFSTAVERGVQPRPWNHRMYDLEPVINGYDPLHIERSFAALAPQGHEHEYRKWLFPEDVTADNGLGVLLFKRSFWLARQYVEGPLPAKDRPFPVAATAFLPHPPPDLPVPRVERSSLPSAATMPDSPRTSASKALGLPRRATTSPGETPFTMELPALVLSPVHSALVVRYRASAPIEAYPTFVDATSGKLIPGARLTLPPTDSGADRFELPLPDYPSITVEFAFTAIDGPAEIELVAAELFSDPADEGGLIEIRSRSANAVDLRVGPLPGARILVFLDAYYPGWKAYVDGAETPVLLANDAFKAVVLPPGTHDVRFVFRPWRVYVGAAVSAVTVVLGLAYVLFPRSRRRRAASFGR